jgi:hypothetical protein
MITGQISDCSLPRTAAKVTELAPVFPAEDVLRMTTTIRIWSQWMDAQVASDAAALLLFPKQEAPTPQEVTVLITAAQGILKNSNDTVASSRWLTDIATYLTKAHPTPAAELAELGHLLLLAGFGTPGIQLLSRLLHDHPVDYHRVFKEDASYWAQLAATFKNAESDGFF